jgi:hypothetical protein
MRRGISKRAIGVVCAMSVWAFCNECASAIVINVPGDQPTIQAGINSAVNGDTVRVFPGTYNEVLDLGGKAITLESFAGREVTTISASVFDTSVITIPDAGGAGQSVVQGFTVTGGKGTLTGSAPSTIRRGGGAFITGGTTILRDCRFTSNTSNAGSGVGAGIYYTGAGAWLTIENCDISGNSVYGGCGGGTGGGLAAFGANLVVVGSSFKDNSCGGSCAGTSGGHGAGVYMSSSALLIDCVIESNGTSGGSVGASGLQSLGTATLVNCRVLDNNSSCISCPGTTASGVANYGGITLVNCTVANNTIAGVPPGAAAGVWNSASGNATLYNCIVFGNEGQQISSSSTALYSCIQNGFAGLGNISSDPLFVDAAGGNFQLQDGSPCRDTGDRNLLPTDTQDLDDDGNTRESLSRDLAFARRIVNGQVDMGAYEWQHACLTDIVPSSPGSAGNGTTNIDDLLTVINNWGTCDQCIADINGDDLVNIDDLLLAINGWGGCK